MTTIAATGDGIASSGAAAEQEALDIHDHADVTGYETIGEPFVDDPKMSARNVNVYYADKQAIMDVSLDIGKNEVIAMIGPSGCGKSTFLRTLNRMNDIIPICRVEGDINLDNENIYRGGQDTVLLRARVGMVFQKPNPFPKSIYENVAYGPKIHGLAHSKAELDEIVEKSLRRASLFDEVKDVLDKPGTGLSGGQIQRICIARALYHDPRILIFDEATSALDTESERLVQDALENMMRNRTSVVIAHRLSTIQNADKIVVLSKGKIVEQGHHQELLDKKGIYHSLVEMQSLA